LGFIRKIIYEEQALFDDVDFIDVIGLVSKLVTDFGKEFILILNFQFFIKFTVVNKVLSNFLSRLMIQAKAF
jgi:hypothetical protein